MSAEACAVVRSLCEAVIAGDLARASDIFDPDVVFRGTRGGLDEGEVLHGPRAVLDYYVTEIAGPWERLDLEIEQLIDAGDVVVVFWRETARARHGDLELQDKTAMLYEVRDRKVVEVRGYLDRDEALEAAGLPT